MKKAEVKEDSLLMKGLDLGGAGPVDEEDKMLLAQIRAMERENAQLLQEALSTYDQVGTIAQDNPDAVGQSPGRTAPFGTEDPLQIMGTKTQAMESRLLELQLEKQTMDAEYSRMPEGAPRNARDRKRKKELEEKLEELNKEIGGLRMKLRNPHMH